MAADLYAVICLAAVAGCMTLAVHPLLRHLKLTEIFPALLVMCAGRLNRRRLAFILRTRRESYLEDLSGVPPWHALAREDLVSKWDQLAAALGLPWRHTASAPPEKTLAGRYPVADTEHVAAALRVSPRSVSVRGISPRESVVTICIGLEEDPLPARRNPWSRLVESELARHRELAEEQRWAAVEARWQDIGPDGRRRA